MTAPVARKTRPNFLPDGVTDALSAIDWRHIRHFPGGPVAYLRILGYSAKDAALEVAQRMRGNPPPEWLGPISRCGKCKSVTTLRACPCGGPLRALTAQEAADYVEKGHEAFPDTRAIRDRKGGIRRYADNPSLILVAGNPRPPAEVERAWKVFHQRDEFTGTVRNVGKIPGAPDYVFALGRCVDVDLGRGPQRFEPQPWLVCDPSDDSLWIVAEKAIKIRHGLRGAEVHAITYAPTASSSKERANFRHEFESPLPEFSPVGNLSYCRAIMLQGGGYRVAGEEWIFA